MKNIAIILAGGSGRRFLGDVPKQFFLIGGRPILSYTIERFNSVENIDEIVIVSHAKFLKDVASIVETYDFEKVAHIIEGGGERFYSVFAALQTYWECDEANILIHDGVRPLASCRLIKKCISLLESGMACVPLLPVTNTVFKVENEKILECVERSGLYSAQTPQCFRLSTLKSAYSKAVEDGGEGRFTDDCSVVKYYVPSVEIKMIEGEAENIKLTFAKDARYVEFLLKEQNGEDGE